MVFRNKQEFSCLSVPKVQQLVTKESKYLFIKKKIIFFSTATIMVSDINFF